MLWLGEQHSGRGERRWRESRCSVPCLLALHGAVHCGQCALADGQSGLQRKHSIGQLVGEGVNLSKHTCLHQVRFFSKGWSLSWVYQSCCGKSCARQLA